MEKKWNLQDIKPASTKKRRRAMEQRVEPVRERTVDDSYESEENESTHIQIENATKKGRSHIIVALLIFVTIVGAGFAASFLMGGAEITVYPRHKEPTVNATFVAQRTPQVGELSYEILTLEADGERQVSATGEEEVTEQATGVITIYKTTPGAERLIKNTRFRSPEGLIFRIAESAVVPGAVKNTAGELVPGTIQAKVFADGVGEQYNLGRSRFTVPGFQEGGFTELYDAIYAENDETFTGGYDGVKFIIDDNELNTAKQALHMELRDALLQRVESEKPAGFVLFDDAVTLTYQTLPAVEYGENLATIKEKAVLQVPLFKEADFASYIAKASIPGYEGAPVRIDNLDTLSFAYTSATTSSTDIGNLNELSFKLMGKPQLVWTFDEGKLKTDLLGTQKTALNAVLGAYPAIERAEAVVRPFWKRSYPNDLDEIEIIEVIENRE